MLAKRLEDGALGVVLGLRRRHDGEVAWFDFVRRKESRRETEVLG